MPKQLVCGDRFQQDTFSLLANMDAVRPERAQPLYLLTPAAQSGKCAGKPCCARLQTADKGAADKVWGAPGFGAEPQGLMPQYFPRAL